MDRGGAGRHVGCEDFGLFHGHFRIIRLADILQQWNLISNLQPTASSLPQCRRLRGDAPRGRVLMFAWMNREALQKSIETGLMHYWSRSRNKLWLKGETSGHTQKSFVGTRIVTRMCFFFEIEQTGGACHTGYQSCFFQQMDGNAQPLPIKEEKIFDDKATYRK